MAGKPDADLAKVLADLAIEMQSHPDTETTLQSIVEGAVAIVPGARWAGVSLIQGRAIEPRVPSDPLVAKLDALQSELNEGPSLSSLREYRTVLINDMAGESRWPSFCQRSLELGVHSLLAFQLYVRESNLGALTLYGDEAGVFSDESTVTGELLAQHASVALSGAEAENRFDVAISSRDLIGQAKGIIMERFDVDGFAAFDLLRRLSQESNTKLTTVARKLVETRGREG